MEATRIGGESWWINWWIGVLLFNVRGIWCLLLPRLNPWHKNQAWSPPHLQLLEEWHGIDQNAAILDEVRFIFDFGSSQSQVYSILFALWRTGLASCWNQVYPQTSNLSRRSMVIWSSSSEKPKTTWMTAFNLSWMTRQLAPSHGFCRQMAFRHTLELFIWLNLDYMPLSIKASFISHEIWPPSTNLRNHWPCFSWWPLMWNKMRPWSENQLAVLMIVAVPLEVNQPSRFVDDGQPIGKDHKTNLLRPSHWWH